MGKIVIGAMALLYSSVLIGVMTHWIVGLAVFAAPVMLTYLLIKLSPKYDAERTKRLEDLLK